MKRKQLLAVLVLFCLAVATGPWPARVVDAGAGHDIASPGTAPTDKGPLPPMLVPASAVDLPADWWATAQEDIRRSEYNVTWQDHTYLANVLAAYQAPNRAQGIRTYFTPQGIYVLSRTEPMPSWQWGLALVGRGEAGLVQVEENRITYGRKGMDERYTNDEDGLEVEVLADMPFFSDSLALEFTCSGNLSPRLVQSGAAVEFRSPAGLPVLRYGNITAVDARGRVLPTRLALAASGLVITVDVRRATAPVAVRALVVGVSASPGSLPDSPSWQVYSSGPSMTPSWFGAAVAAAGDVNGDGYADVLVGEPLYDGEEEEEVDIGRVYLYYGSATGLSTTAAWVFSGDWAGAHLGAAVAAAGDVDGDGYGDIIVGAPGYSNGEVGEGAAFLFYGDSWAPSSSPDWMAEGNQAGAEFGYAVGTAGSQDWDGRADIIVGAPGYSNGQVGEGAAFAYYSGGGLSSMPDWSAEGNQAGARFGHTVGVAGDVDGDGYPDVVIGAPGYDGSGGDEGRDYLYSGSFSGLNSSSAWTGQGNCAGGQFGYSAGPAGDVNGDGYADIVVGTPNAGGSCNADGSGRVYAYYGSDMGLPGMPSWTIQGIWPGAHLGWSVSTAGDVNDDGYGDVIVGAPDYADGNTREGRIMVYLGTEAGLTTAEQWAYDSNRQYVAMGYAVGTAGDVNGDGYGDLLAGAPWCSLVESNCGEAYAFYGGELEAAPPFDPVDDPGQDQAYLGCAVSTAGDVNGDGYADIIIGAYGYDNGQVDEGRAFLFQGSVSGPLPSPAWTAESDQAGAYFGYAVGIAGDVNADGFSDVIVGAYHYDGDGDTVDEGRVYLYLGGAAGLSPSASWTDDGSQDGGRLGWAVGTAGDVNDDGYSDVVAGMPFYDNGQADEGAALAYYGSPVGLPADPNRTVEGDQAGAHLGWAVDTAGDANGDGYSDIVVGAPDYDDGAHTDFGQVRIYYGSAAGLGIAPGWSDPGTSSPAEFGSAVGTAGDVNGDGYSDIIVGNYLGFGYSGETGGGAYVYYGSATGPGTAPNWSQYGKETAAAFGYTVGTAGDVNGDGYGDVIIGTHTTARGWAALYQGGPSGLATAATWTARSASPGTGFGYAAGTAGDVNGDGFSEVVVGEPHYSNGQVEEGRAYIYMGRSGSAGKTTAWTAESNQLDAALGNAVSTAGDVNGDGYADVVIGAYYYDNGETDEGKVFAWYGSAQGLGLGGTPGNADWSVEGNQSYAYLGYAVGTAGDVNGDGYADVAAGAYGYDNGQTDEGRVYVYHGSSAGLSLVADWMAEGNQPYAGFGRSLGTAGDVNGDGYSDLVIGAYDTLRQVYAYYGSAAGLGSVPSWTYSNGNLGYSVATAGDVNGDGFSDVLAGSGSDCNVALFSGSASGLPDGPSWSVTPCWTGGSTVVSTAGDVNGDGYADILVGVPLYTDHETEEGALYLYYGDSWGPNNWPWTIESNHMNSHLGAAVGTAGDVNGDGYADVLVTEPGYGTADHPIGRAYLYHGSATGLGMRPAWQEQGSVAGEGFGLSSSAAGDVNGDGYADIIVGAPLYANGETGEGQVFLYYGNKAAGLSLCPGQLRMDAVTPIAPLGLTDASDRATVRLTGRMPLGRSDVRLGWQMAELGTPFEWAGAWNSASWADTGVAGVAVVQDVSGMWEHTPYHWRVRLLYRPGNRLGLPAGRWIHVPWNGWEETDLRTPSPTAVKLLSFVAEPASGGVLLAWETASERDNVGFNLYRSETEEVLGLLLNDGLIPSALPGGGWGASYDFLDKTPRDGTAYYYTLESVDASGQRARYGPVTTVLRRVYLPLLLSHGAP